MKDQLTAIPTEQSRSSYKSASIEFKSRRSVVRRVYSRFSNCSRTNENPSVILRQFAGTACLVSCIVINVDPLSSHGTNFNKHGKESLQSILSLRETVFANIRETLYGRINLWWISRQNVDFWVKFFSEVPDIFRNSNKKWLTYRLYQDIIYK